MLNPIYIGLGMVLLALGIGSIYYPQAVANVGAEHRYEDAQLSESGRTEQRWIGIIVSVIGVLMILAGIFG